MGAAVAVGSACELGDTEVRPIHASFEIRPGPGTQENENWFLGQENDEIRGVLVLEPVVLNQAGAEDFGERLADLQPDAQGSGEPSPETDGDHMSGIIALRGDRGARVHEIDARYEGGLVTFEEGESFSVPDHGAHVVIDEFEIALDDSAGDGVFDSGTGSLTGAVETLDVMHFEEITDGVITAEPDVAGAEVILRSTGFNARRAFPYDGVSVHFTKPVRADDVRDHLGLVIDGESAAADISASADVDMPVVPDGASVPLATRATLRPADPIPEGAELTIDTTDIRDLSGLGVASEQAALDASPDLGSAHENMDFSGDFEGWHAGGTIEMRDEFETATPEDDAEFVVMQDRSQLVASLELPDDAASIALTATGFSEGGSFPGATLEIDVVYPDGEEVSAFSPGPIDHEDMITCEFDDGCARYFSQTEPLPVEIDVDSAAGERVFFRITLLESAGWPYWTHEHGAMPLQPPPSFAAAIENLELHTGDGD